MAKPSSRPPSKWESAEAKFDRVTKAAADSVETERSATRKKTARLKALRLKRDASEGKTELDKPRKKPTPRAK